MRVERWPVRVLYVDNTFTFGGAILSLADLVGALDRASVDPVVVSGQPQPFLEQAFPGCSVHHWRVRVRWHHGSTEGGPLARWVDRGPARRLRGVVSGAAWTLRQDLPDALRLARIGRRHAVDLVHLNNTVESQHAGLLAARMLRVPCVAHARGLQTPNRSARRYARIPARHVAISGVIEENLRALGVGPDRIAVVPDGIDLEQFHPAAPPPTLRRELGIPEGAPVFGSFGRIMTWKGVRELVNASALVMRALPSAYALVVGDASDGEREYDDEVRALARALGIGDRVLFLGHRADVPELMRLCDVIVHSSIEPEPFGRVVAEGMAVGKPVVAASSGGPTEMVVPGETGALVDPRDARALASAIEDLLSDPEGAARMGRKAAARARAEYSASRCAERVLGIYREVLRRPIRSIPEPPRQASTPTAEQPPRSAPPPPERGAARRR